ncbi:MAG: DegT/DnrJ/EryC1/StrS family aminotransferase [Candidatus Hydrogenedentes bacterium]|nr:DegT/DnrJ/EryC1/StrS family aminotransferase [Candidatus Hydrogenedentota bacterium]
MSSNSWRFGEEELAYVKEVLECGLGSSLDGTMNQRLERAFCERMGVRYGITHNSGTSTMHSCLFAAGVKPGDEVLVPALTVISTAAVVVHQNAIPVFVDIDPETFNMDPASVQAHITPKTKAIIPVHLYGLPVDMDPIMALAEKHGLIVIEDCAQCFLGTYKGKLSGTMGHMASFSFENTKHMSTGDGGIVITDNEESAEKIRKFSCQGYAILSAESGTVRGPAGARPAFQDPNYKRHEFIGWNYRLPEVAAAVGLAQVARLDSYVEKRQQIAALYEAAIDGCPWLTAQKIPEGYVSACWTFAMAYTGDAAIGVPRDDFVAKYNELSGDSIYAAWQCVYNEPAFAEKRFYGSEEALYRDVDYRPGLCPVAEKVQPTLMQLKNNFGELAEAEKMAEALRDTIKHFG